MKKSTILFCAICSLTMGGTAQAVLPTAPYDNFTASLINSAKWFGGESDDARANLENIRNIVGNATLGNRLRLYGRGYGASGLSFGTRFGSNSLYFRNPSRITAIKASVWASSATVTGCPSNPNSNDAPRVRARLGGTFFNASANPIPGDLTNDVLAQIRIQRVPTDPANVLKVEAKVSLCQDSDCFTGPTFLEAEMGTVNVGQKVTLSLEWDKAGNRFIFRRDALAPVIRTYTLSDASAPGYDFKNLQAAYFVANCDSATPPIAVMDAYFDDVYTNPLPASSAVSAAMEEIDSRHIIYNGSSIEPAGP
jgi:hypothetical protein